MGGVNRFPWLYDDDGHLVEEKVLSEMADFVHYARELDTIVNAITGISFAECQYQASTVLSYHEEMVETIIQAAIEQEAEFHRENGT